MNVSDLIINRYESELTTSKNKKVRADLLKADFVLEFFNVFAHIWDHLRSDNDIYIMVRSKVTSIDL